MELFIVLLLYILVEYGAYILGAAIVVGIIGFIVDHIGYIMLGIGIISGIFMIIALKESVEERNIFGRRDNLVSRWAGLKEALLHIGVAVGIVLLYKSFFDDDAYIAMYFTYFAYVLAVTTIEYIPKIGNWFLAFTLILSFVLCILHYNCFLDFDSMMIATLIYNILFVFIYYSTYSPTACYVALLIAEALPIVIYCID